MSQRRLHTSSCPNRASSSAYVAANSHVPAHRESSYGIFAIEHDNEVCDVGADLKTPANTSSSDA